MKTLKGKTINTKVIIITLSLLVNPVALGLTEPTDFNNLSLKNHVSIHIDGNDDFTVKNGVTSGDGTPENPYIISNWIISQCYGYGISVKNTNAYFVIENCFISGSKTLKSIGVSPIGIQFSNVTNGRIINCTCINCAFGILLLSSSNNTIENCRCEYTSHGISINGCPYGYATHSSNNQIKNCTFTNCEDGIYFCCLPSSSNNLIDNCTISNNKRGVVLDHCVHYTIIVNCNISHNSLGVEIISASSRNYLCNNIFYKNKEHARDNCKNTWDSGPVFGGNYWCEHNTSQPYEIPGAGGDKDYYPLNKKPVNKPLMPFFRYSPLLPIVGDDTFFDASLSYGEDVINYKWDFGDGSRADGCKVKHVYSNEGWYNVTLKVTNKTTSNSFIRRLHVIKLSEGVIHVPDDISTIQGAVNIAEPGYTIQVKNGTYHENVIINKPYLKLFGSGCNTVIDGKGKGDVVTVTAPFVTIQSFGIINGSDKSAGVQLGEPDYVVDALGCCIKNNIVSGNGFGVNLSETENNVVEWNVVTGNKIAGIHSIRSYSNIIKHNQVFLNNIGLLFEYGSNWNKLTGNAVVSNKVGLDLRWSHYNMVERNNVVGNEVGLNLSNALSPLVNYNNIQLNRKYGVCFTGETLGVIPNLKHNWWGSKLGPSWLIKVFGDRVWMIGLKPFKPRFLGVRLICFPWSKTPVEVSF